MKVACTMYAYKPMAQNIEPNDAQLVSPKLTNCKWMLRRWRIKEAKTLKQQDHKSFCQTCSYWHCVSFSLEQQKHSCTFYRCIKLDIFDDALKNISSKITPLLRSFTKNLISIKLVRKVNAGWKCIELTTHGRKNRLYPNKFRFLGLADEIFNASMCLSKLKSLKSICKKTPSVVWIAVVKNVHEKSVWNTFGASVSVNFYLWFHTYSHKS